MRELTLILSNLLISVTREYLKIKYNDLRKRINHMKTKEIQKEVGKHAILKGHFPVAENISYLLLGEADVISVGGSGYVWEYEVKISKSDFKAESKKHFKHKALQEGYETGPNYFVFCCVPELIQLADIHPSYGLYYVYEDGVDKIRSPKLLHKHKHDFNKIVTKVARALSERSMLGCCLLTHRNKERRKSWDRFNDGTL